MGKDKAGPSAAIGAEAFRRPDPQSLVTRCGEADLRCGRGPVAPRPIRAARLDGR